MWLTFINNMKNKHNDDEWITINTSINKKTVNT